ncbi:ead/Ea22-like family protein [Citrobacter freundii]|nr:ead/Ea22-like family protein [Citrobacter freundii]
MTALNKQALRSKARSASAGEWIKESGDGWEAICSSDNQANGNFIIAHFEGPDALANREFVQAANPDTVLAMLDELEAAEKRIAELESNEIREDGNQFLVVRHPGKTPVIKHCSGDLEEFLRNLIEQDPLVTIDIITHRCYGVGGQWVQDADEYLHMMAAAGIGVKGE